MQDDIIEKASSREITENRAEHRKGDFLRPTVTRGESYSSDYGGSTRKGSTIKLVPTGSSTFRPLSKIDWQADWDKTPNQSHAVGNVAPVDDGLADADLMDMLRMGKTQEMRRVFRQFSLISFSCLSQSTWEFALLNNDQALLAGGTPLLFWSFVWSFAGSMLVTASLSEMCSIAPTSGGQYHWVSEFAGKNYQQFLSYCTGWFTVVGWQLGNASSVLLVGSLMQSIITVYRPSNGDSVWQSIVFTLPAAAFVIIFNIYGGRAIMLTQNVTMSIHMLALVALLVVLVVLAPHIPAERALMHLNEDNGWPNMALAVFAGQSNMNFTIQWSDSAVHMAEEVQDAGLAVPKAMMRSTLICGITGLLLVLTFSFCIPSVSDATNHPTGFAFLYVMGMTASRGVTVSWLVILIILVAVSSIGFTAASARSTFAFSRDRGLPFSAWIAKVNKGSHVPVNAVLLTAAVSVLCSLIYLASDTAFYGVVSLGQATQSSGFVIAISSMLYRRLKSPERLPKARWSLERYCGRPGAVTINVLAIVYSINTAAWSFSPGQLPVKASNWNLAPTLFVLLVVLMLLTYHLKAKKVYVGPVVYTRDTPSWNTSQFQEGGLTGQNMQFLTIPEET